VRAPRKPGALKGKIRITKAFFEPLPEDVLAAFEGRVSKKGRHRPK
jgi:hypothetical protein